MKIDDVLENVVKCLKFFEICIFFIYNLYKCCKIEINIVYDLKGNVNYMISSLLINVVKM